MPNSHPNPACGIVWNTDTASRRLVVAGSSKLSVSILHIEANEWKTGAWAAGLDGPKLDQGSSMCYFLLPFPRENGKGLLSVDQFPDLLGMP